MKYKNRTQAEAAMSAWVETTIMPCLALVQGDGYYQIVEADLDGTIVILPDEQVVETQWGSQSGGISEIAVVNAYTAACCYHVTYSKEVSIRVPHGTQDLTMALGAAKQHADQSDGWRACNDPGPIFIDAMSHGEDTCAWSDGLPIPEEFSEEGPSPVVVVRTDAGRYDAAAVVRGEAHVIVTDQDLNELGRSQPDDDKCRFGHHIGAARRELQAISLLRRMQDRIGDFAKECENARETDPSVAWIILNDFDDAINEVVGDRSLPF